MRIAYFNNAKIEAECLDGEMIKLHNLNARKQRNLGGSEPFTNGRLAIVYGNFDGDRPINATVDFDE